MGRRIALLFPGQGAHALGMGRLAAERFPEARATFERVDAALAAPISAMCFEGPDDRLQETRWQQPAIFATSLAVFMAWRGARPADDAILVAAGHSLGEYSALVAAGALTLEDGARLVALRGQLMQQAAGARPGGMVAILGLDRDTMAAVCAEATAADPAAPVTMANDNAPGQQVISGAAAALERATAAARARGARRAVPLKVAGAFHSPLMEPAVAGLRDALAATPIARCTFPVIANSTCEPLLEPEAIRAELARQVTSAVRWTETLHTMASFAPDAWVDTGPGGVVAGLAARTLGLDTIERLAETMDSV